MGLACVYAPNTPTWQRHLWDIMAISLPKDCTRLLRETSIWLKDPMTNQIIVEELSRDGFSWNEFLNAFQMLDIFHPLVFHYCVGRFY